MDVAKPGIHAGADWPYVAQPTRWRIRPVRHDEVVKHWSVTSLTARSAGSRRIDVRAALMNGIVERLQTLPELGWPSAWCAVAQSREGEHVLHRAGFRRRAFLQPDVPGLYSAVGSESNQLTRQASRVDSTRASVGAQPRRNRRETATFVVCPGRTADQPGGGVAGCSRKRYLGSPQRGRSEVRPIW